MYVDVFKNVKYKEYKFLLNEQDFFLYDLNIVFCNYVIPICKFPIYKLLH